MVLSVVFMVLAVAAGWENICAGRVESDPSPAIWKADFSRPDNFSWALREGAEGNVSIGRDGIRITKTNDEGYILVTAKAFAVKPGQGVRFSADQVSTNADVNYSSGVLRYFGRQERSLGLCTAAERLNFWNGGLHTMRALPCTPPGMPYRKFGQCFAEDDVLTPAIVVSGRASESLWSEWLAEDLDGANRHWKELTKDLPLPDYRHERQDERAFDEMMAKERDHTAKVERRDGVSRLVIDGEVVSPVAYRATVTAYDPVADRRELFAGKSLGGSAVRLMGREVSLAGHWSAEKGFDFGNMAAQIKSAMRLAGDSLFFVAINGTTPKGFVSKLHPQEAWLDEDGNPVRGGNGSCIASYKGTPEARRKFEREADVWPSPSSPSWRNWVVEGVKGLVAELKAQNLSKRIVGVQMCGFHDGQYSIPYIDTSRWAGEEYRRMLAEGNLVSTNYAFCMKQSYFRAQELFTREFKKALDKESLGILWCESPFEGAINASMFLTSFVRSDALDIVVCQPKYRERLPGYPTVSALPFDSLHLHGKLFFNEYDIRTYANIKERGRNGFVSSKSIGMAADFPMWQTIYRKLAGEADATRMGYWLYDMRGGWFTPREIDDDIKALVREEEMFARLKPSPWRPDVAVVLDEAQILPEGERPLKRINPADEFIYASQCRLLGSSAVPYERYLAEDVIERPEILDGKKMVVFAFMRDIDGRRSSLLRRLASQGTTLVYLSETGTRGGAGITGFEPYLKEGSHNHRMRNEPGVEDSLISLMDSYQRRESNISRNTGRRCSVRENGGIKVLARYVSDGLPAVAERFDADCRRVYVAEPSGLTPSLMNRLARESGAYVAVDSEGLQIDMNGDFVSVHCLKPGDYAFRMPFSGKLINLRSGADEPIVRGFANFTLTAGETRRFRLLKNPWTHQNFLDDPGEFSFAIIPDRTGGDHRGAWTNALAKVNLLRPEFVMSIGDIIPGSWHANGKVRRQWQELKTMLSRVEPPFYSVVGNHDLEAPPKEDMGVFNGANVHPHEDAKRMWQEFNGPEYYSFVHKDVLFVCLNSMDSTNVVGMGRKQCDWFRRTLEDHQDVRWTFVFMHAPKMWTLDEWIRLEDEVLSKRKYTVFAGDWHSYMHVRRLGRDYYVLSVAGGASSMHSREYDLREKLEGVQFGEMDHLTWVTMTKDGPRVANICLDGILPGDYLNLLTTRSTKPNMALDRPVLPGSLERIRKNKAAEEMRSRNYDVWAARFGYRVDDATACLEKAMASGARRLVIDEQRGPWIVARPVKVRSNTTVIIDDGVEVVRKRGVFPGDKPIFDTTGSTNVTIRIGRKKIGAF